MSQPEPEEPTTPAIVPLISDHTLIENDWAWTFLASYTGQDHQNNVANTSKAYRKAGVSKKTYDERRQHDPAFRQLCDQADEAIADALFERFYQQTFQGINRPVTARGEIIAHVNEINGTDAKWILERLKPERFHLPTVIEMVSPDTPGAFTFQLGEEPLQLEPGNGPAE